jgi:hypothetical protein
MENQYFTDDTLVDALCDAIKARPQLEVILLNNINPDLPFYRRGNARLSNECMTLLVA